jgi:Uma2 family endonuclease
MSELKEKFLPNYTYDDYKQWEGRWELINGIPFAMSPAPSFNHQKVNGRIHIQLEKLLESCKKCQAVLPVDWRIPGYLDNNVLQPDNLIFCKDVDEIYITEAPVLIFEILSPSSVLKDRFLKYDIYESQGVKYYVIVDIDLKSADVFELKNGAYSKTIEAKNDIVRFVLDENSTIDFNFSEIWV